MGLQTALPNPEFTCKTCAFWDKEGRCRRLAPEQFMHNATGNVLSSWPMAAADDWCGQHRLPRVSAKPGAPNPPGRPRKDRTPLLEYLRSRVNTIPTAIPLRQLHRLADQFDIAPSLSTFHEWTKEWLERGMLVAVETPGEPTRYYAPKISSAAAPAVAEMDVE